MKAKFLGKNGYDHQLKEAKELLEIGEEYEIEDAEVNSWISYVKINGKFYNSVMFGIGASELLKEFPDSKAYYG